MSAPSDPTLLRAAWLAPMDRPPIREGGIVFRDGRIVAVGDAAQLACAFPAARAVDAGESVILPGLVNAHVHLELTRFAREPLPADGFVGWVLALRRRALEAGAAGAGDAAIAASAEAGIAQCLRFGVTCVGDIAFNAAVVRRALAASPLRGVSYGEVLGMAGRISQLGPLLQAAIDRSAETASVRHGIEPHAPYSLELPGYRRCVEEALRTGMPVATHLAETPDEGEFLSAQTGSFRRLWESLGAWTDDVPRFDGGPIRAMQSVGLLDLPALLAHVNYCEDDELDILAAGRASVVYCPRTHAYFGHSPHRWREMLAHGINVAVGTDSCASSPDLNLVDDLRLLRRIAPDVPAIGLWELITTRGARALGLENEAGALRVGAAADCIVFPVAGDDPLTAILESGVRPSQVWLRGSCLERS